MSDWEKSAEAAFREAANRRAALEARLSADQRAQYDALRQKQDIERQRESDRLEKRRQTYVAEQRKHNIAPTLEMIQRDRITPRALRDAARELAAQEQWLAGLGRQHDRQCDSFLKSTLEQPQEQDRNQIHADDHSPDRRRSRRTQE